MPKVHGCPTCGRRYGLRAEIERLRSALEYYADEGRPDGYIAIEALKDEGHDL